MESDQDEPYENVIFRNSKIVYPPDLVTDASSGSCDASPQTNSDNRPRRSVLEAFDPVLQRKSILPLGKLPNYSEILLRELDIDPPPPPLPQRNPKAQVHHYHELSRPCEEPPPVPRRQASKMPHSYDPVAIERGLSQISMEHSIDENKTLQHLTNKTKDNIKELVNRVSKVANGEWLPNFKRSTLPSEGATFTSHVPSATVGHAGNLAWCVSSGLRKEPQTYCTELKNGVLSCFTGINGDTPVHVIKLETLLSIAASASEDSLSFEICTSKDKSKVVLTAGCFKERVKWMEWILEGADREAFTAFHRRYYDRCSRVFIKEGVTGEWHLGWILVQAHSKQLYLQTSHGHIVSEDLRKVRSITQPNSGDIADCPLANQSAAPIIFHWSDHTTYIQSNSKVDTECWLQLTRSIALQSGEDLEENQLTIEDVPVLVECCVKFIETYGMLTEGIYRRSGVQSKIVRLLALLRNDAWSVHISSEEYTEHDVANVLKRFFRTLPDPLLRNELYSHWIDGLSLEQDLQLKCYKNLIECLPKVHKKTLCRLLGHLHAVQNKCEKNLMTVSNLASLWGPTLMTVESGRDHTSNFSHTNAETDVVVQLIQYYPWLFDVDREKLAVNDQISEVQEKLEQGVLGLKKSAGDIRTWIYSEIAAKEVSVEIGPKLTVEDVLKDLALGQSKRAFLMESICNGELQRPLSLEEFLLPTILKWADWPEDDRRNNQLVYATNNIINSLLTQQRALPQKSMFELHYVDPKGKAFRSHPFEYCQARFTLLKDIKSRSVLVSWDIENIIWYLGYDQRRIPPTNWCISFIEKDNRVPKKGKNYFGHCLSFNSEEDLLKLLHAVIVAEHQGGLASFYL